MKDRTMATDPIDHDEVLKNFAPPELVDESKLPLSSWAVIATLAGVLAFVTAVAGIGGYIAVAAIVCGHAGHREIKNGIKGGRAWAQGGLWLGYGTLALLLIGNIVENFS